MEKTYKISWIAMVTFLSAVTTAPAKYTNRPLNGYVCSDNFYDNLTDISQHQCVHRCLSNAPHCPTIQSLTTVSWGLNLVHRQRFIQSSCWWYSGRQNAETAFSGFRETTIPLLIGSLQLWWAIPFGSAVWVREIIRSPALLSRAYCTLLIWF